MKNSKKYVLYLVIKLLKSNKINTIYLSINNSLLTYLDSINMSHTFELIQIN